MFDIGWTEMLVVACVAIIVVGPKDLPKMLRAFGRTMKSVRGLAGDFQKQFEEAVRDADLDDVKDIATGKKFNPLEDIKKSVSDYEKDVREQMSAKAVDADGATKKGNAGLPKPVAEKLGIETESTKADSAAEKPEPKSPAKKPSAARTAARKSSGGKATASKSASSGTAKKAASKSAAKSPAGTTTKKTPKSAKTVKAAKSA